MSFQARVFSIFFLSFCICNISNGNVFSMRDDYFTRFRDVLLNFPTCIMFDDSQEYVNFLIKFYESDPIACLNEAFTIDDSLFAYLLFNIISTRGDKQSFLCLDDNHCKRALEICNYIKSMIIDILFEPYDSLAKLQKNNSVIQLLIKFLQKYSKSSYYLPLFSKDIERFQNTINYLLVNSPDGNIYYKFLFSLGLWPNGKIDFILTSNSDEFSKNGLTFFSYLHQIIRGKDFKIFECQDSDLVLLLAFILDNIDDQGLSTFPEYDSDRYYSILTSFFIQPEGSYQKLLWRIKFKKKDLVTMAESIVGDLIKFVHKIFLLAASIDAHFDKFPSQFNRNILFQLKCLCALEEYLYGKFDGQKLFLPLLL
jgi:hypothetical protein